MSIIIKYHSNLGSTYDLAKEKNFSAGEVHVNLRAAAEEPDIIDIRADIRNSEDLMRLMMVSDSIQRRYPETVKYLRLPYLPYSRQDRACAEGDAFSLDVLARMLALYPYKRIHTWDVHSSVAGKLIPNLTNAPQVDLISSWPSISSRIQGLVSQDGAIVAPDAGALMKTNTVSARYGFTTGTYARKVRDSSNGEITGTAVEGGTMILGRDVLICDDICDGGRTFIELAKVLKRVHGAKKVVLYVTHGILSKGCDLINEWIDEMYIYNYIGSGPISGNIFVRRNDV